VLSPEGFASILWKDSKRAAEAAEVMKLTADDLRSFGMIDVLISEPEGSIAADPASAIEALKLHLDAALTRLCKLDGETLLSQRYEKYRKFR
jgi:acetyl-CoA carboxylase alpha subunit